MIAIDVVEPDAITPVDSIQLMFTGICQALKVACIDGCCLDVHVADGWMRVDAAAPTGFSISISASNDGGTASPFEWHVSLYSQNSNATSLILILPVDKALRFPIDAVIGIVAAASTRHVGNIRKAIDRVLPRKWCCATKVLRSFVEHEARRAS